MSGMLTIQISIKRSDKMKEQEIPDLNIFMICNKLNKNALSDLPCEYHIRNCRPDELEL